MRKHAFKWLLCLALVLSMVPASMAAEGPCSQDSPEAHLEWENAQSLNALFDSTEVTAAVTTLDGYYYLEDDLELTSTSSLTRFFEIASGTDVTICLNGYSLSGSYQSTSTCVFMRVYGNLNICDCKGTGTVTYVSESTTGGSTINTKSGCTVNVYGGNITGNTNPRYGTIFCEGGTFTLHENGKVTGNSSSTSGDANKNGCFYVKNTTVKIYGEVSDNHSVGAGGAFDIRSGGKVYLYDGGKISDNTTDSAGGGVYIQGGIFYMEGGEISGNEAAAAGGGIRIYSGSLRLKKGVIKNNVAGTNGGGVSSRRDTTITGTTITGNTAALEGGGFYYDGDTQADSGNSFSMSAGSIAGNTATDGMANDLYITGGYQTLAVSGGTVDSLFVDADNSVTVSGGTVSNIYNDGTLTISGGDITGLTVGDNATDTILTGGSFDQEYTDCTMGEGLSFVTTKSGELAVAGDFHGGDNSNMVLKQNLDMNLYFEGMTKTPAKAMVYMGEKTPFEVAAQEGENGAYYITVPVSAKEMSTEIEIELFDSKGNLISVSSDSVKEYGERMLADPEQSAVHSLIVDMLNYGAAAQQYLAAEGEEIGTLANAGIDAYQDKKTDVQDVFDAAYADWGNVTYANTRAYSFANLTLDNEVDFNLYFWVGQIGDDKSFTCKVNGVDQEPGTFSEMLDGELVYKVKIADLAVADLADAEVEITFTDLDGEKTITDSVYNYLVRNDGYGKWSKDGVDNTGLSKALMAFATSAAAYTA